MKIDWISTASWQLPQNEARKPRKRHILCGTHKFPWRGWMTSLSFLQMLASTSLSMGHLSSRERLITKPGVICERAEDTLNMGHCDSLILCPYVPSNLRRSSHSPDRHSRTSQPRSTRRTRAWRYTGRSVSEKSDMDQNLSKWTLRLYIWGENKLSGKPSYPVRHSLEGAGHPPHRLHEDAVLALLKLRTGLLNAIMPTTMILANRESSFLGKWRLIPFPSLSLHSAPACCSSSAGWGPSSAARPCPGGGGGRRRARPAPCGTSCTGTAARTPCCRYRCLSLTL